MGNTPSADGGAPDGSRRLSSHLSAASLSMKFKRPSFTAAQQQAPLPPKAPAQPLSDLSHIPRPKPITPVDRLMSCPDQVLRSEAEIVGLLLKFFAYDVNENTPSSDALLHKFDNKSGVAPKISVEVYISRIIKYFHQVADGVKAQGDSDVHSDLPVRYFVATIIYIDRMRAAKGLNLSPLNVHRLIIAGVLMAAKVLDDLQPSLQWFSELGGVEVHELAELELALLDALSFQVTIDAQLFSRRYQTVLLGNSDNDFKEFDLAAHRKTPPA